MSGSGRNGAGYATIGTVVSADRDVLAQTKTHDTTRFRAVSVDGALAARAERKASSTRCAPCSARSLTAASPHPATKEPRP